MDFSGRRILIVEDEADIRETLRNFFESEGAAVSTAGHGQQALDVLAAEQHPHLILLDLMMPVMNGEVFVSQKNQGPVTAQIPVVIMSADHYTEQRANSMKIKWFIRKPLSLQSLITMAEEALGV